MTAKTREILKEVQVELPIRVNKHKQGSLYVFRGDELIDTLELAIIKSPELKQELKNLIEEILR